MEFCPFLRYWHRSDDTVHYISDKMVNVCGIFMCNYVSVTVFINFVFYIYHHYYHLMVCMQKLDHMQNTGMVGMANVSMAGKTV